MILTSTQNPRVKEAIALRDRRDRNKTNQFLIEGYRETLRAIEGNWKIDTLFICRELFLGSNEESLIERIEKKGTKIYPCDVKVFKKISYRDRPDGILAIAPQVHRSLDSLVLKKNPFLIVAEAIEKPGNLGTILRSSDAVGLDALIAADPCTDIYNPNVVRASVGTLFTVPIVEAGGKEALSFLKENKISVLAATPSAKKEFTEVDLRGPVAIAVGTEQLGLSPLWMENADIQVKIPMRGVADSLNVAMATTLLLYEAIRQRRSV